MNMDATTTTGNNTQLRPTPWKPIVHNENLSDGSRERHVTIDDPEKSLCRIVVTTRQKVSDWGFDGIRQW
jgi:hypothetical protein